MIMEDHGGNKNRNSNRPQMETCVHPCPSAHVLKCTIDEGLEILAASHPARQLIHAAATGCDVAAQRVLLQEAGAQDGLWRHSCDRSGDSALLLAARGGYRSIAQLLASHNADLNWQNQDGETALHAACHRGHAEIVEILCTFHADPRMGELSANEVPGLTAVRRHAKMLQQEPISLVAGPHQRERQRSCVELCLASMVHWGAESPAASLVNIH